MSQQTSKTTVDSVVWSSFGRYKVGMNVSHNGSVWINTTGKNSEPGVGSDFLSNGGSKLSDFNDDIGATDLEVVIVTEKSQLVNQALDPTKKYAIKKDLVLTEGEYIIMDNSPLIEGLGADYTNISTTAMSGIIFRSNACGNINIKNISLSSLATSSSVFDLVDSDGSHEFRLIGVNFVGCKILGNLSGFRQWFSKDLGFYGCSDGFTMSGSWTGMYFDQANMFGITTGATFFKEGTSLTFSGRCLFQSNFDVPAGVVFMDFMPDVFSDIEALQINNTVAKVDGVKNQINATTLFPNIGANNPKSLWGINDGLPSTASELIIIDDDVSGNYVIDWLNDTYDLTLTADTTFTEINTPASGRRTKTINITISGDYTPTFPADWELNKVGGIKIGDLNDIDVKFISTGKYSMKISNSLSVYPAPILGSITPVSVIPNSTSEVIISGSFYTPQGFVMIDGQVVNSIEFDADTGNYILSVSSSLTDGEYDITISNGTEVTFEGRFIVNLGVVYIATPQTWLNIIEPVEFVDASCLTKTYTSQGSADLDMPFDLSSKFEIRIDISNTPLVFPFPTIETYFLKFEDLTTGYTNEINRYNSSGASQYQNRKNGGSKDTFYYNNYPAGNDYIRFSWDLSTMVMYINNTLVYTFEATNFQNDFKLTFLTGYLDFKNIKYIELP